MTTELCHFLHRKNELQKLNNYHHCNYHNYEKVYHVKESVGNTKEQLSCSSVCCCSCKCVDLWPV